MERKMSKRDMINIFKRMGHDIKNSNVTKASKNAADAVYWANPTYTKLTKDWHLILHDTDHSELLLFAIPAYSIPAGSLSPRNDRLINLKIAHNDTSYIDVPSGFSFAQFLVDEVIY